MKGWIKASMIAGLAAGIIWLLIKTGVISEQTKIVGDVIGNFYVQLLLGIGSAIVFAVAFFFALVYVPAKTDNKREKDIGKLKDKIRQLQFSPFVFPVLAYHAEYKIKNAGAKRVWEIIKNNLLELFSYAQIGNTAYDINQDAIQFFDPEKSNSLQYAIIVPGIKYDTVIDFGEAIRRINPKRIDEMFVISIVAGSQGKNKTSLLKFDTDFKEVYAPFSNSIRDELMKTINLEIIEDETHKPYEKK
ncbi:MAG TPA: hypothetical protein VLX61_00715 [Anaerolineales bacterium]|nr:hypothetical protein [Anaerolineales bacterium]